MQWLIVYGSVRHPHIYTTAYDHPDITRQVAKCVARHGRTVRPRAIHAEKLPPSRVKN